mmetsp:Transcript_108988/g.314790  ORF Transcript_108988/g.314790 Transcript_108988/m.314790 type:complete len:228 (+) Transcript_108988:3688-4371(+)
MRPSLLQESIHGLGELDLLRAPLGHLDVGPEVDQAQDDDAPVQPHAELVHAPEIGHQPVLPIGVPALLRLLVVLAGQGRDRHCRIGRRRARCGRRCSRGREALPGSHRGRQRVQGVRRYHDNLLRRRLPLHAVGQDEVEVDATDGGEEPEDPEELEVQLFHASHLPHLGVHLAVGMGVLHLLLQLLPHHPEDLHDCAQQRLAPHALRRQGRAGGGVRVAGGRRVVHR